MQCNERDQSKDAENDNIHLIFLHPDVLPYFTRTSVGTSSRFNERIILIIQRLQAISAEVESARIHNGSGIKTEDLLGRVSRTELEPDFAGSWYNYYL